MARPQYPLETLRKLRDERADAQATRLAAQIARADAAQARLSDAERARREHEARTRAVLTTERERLGSGAASGADLQRLTEFEQAMRAQERGLEQLERELRDKLSAEREAERRERSELSRLEAEAKLVQGHEARF